MSLCLFGATIQVLALITLYFRFPVTTVIEMSSPSKVTIPSFSVCFSYQIPINFSLELLPGPEPNLTDFRYEMDIGSLDEFTASYEQFVRNCEVIKLINGSMQSLDCLNFTVPITHINGQSKCFTLFRDSIQPLTYERYVFGDEFLIYLELAPEHAMNNDVFISLHGNKEVEYENGPPGAIFLDYNPSNYFIVTFYVHNIKKKGPPYTNCKSYMQTDGIRRDEAIRKCIFEDVYADHKAFSEKTFIQIPSQFENSTFSKDIPQFEYRAKCENVYNRPECESELVEIQLLRQIYWSKYNGTAAVRIAYPLGLQADIVMTNMLDDVEYLCFITSVVGLWIEISLLAMVRFVFTSMRKLTSNFARKANVERLERVPGIKPRRHPVNRINTVSIHGRPYFFPRHHYDEELRYGPHLTMGSHPARLLSFQTRFDENKILKLLT